jgi:putative oxidoreductase
MTSTAFESAAPIAPTNTLGRSLAGVLTTNSDAAATVARLALGIMILPHGLQKAFGLFGGYGFEGTMGFLTGTLGIPAAFAFLAIVAEVAGGLGLILGAIGRVAAFGVGTVMVTAALTVHLPNGFFMNWGGGLPAGAEGWEFHLLAAALAVVVMLRGSGALSVDRLVTKKIS